MYKCKRCRRYQSHPQLGFLFEGEHGSLRSRTSTIVSANASLSIEIGTNASLSIEIGRDPFFLGLSPMQLFLLPLSSSLVFTLISTLFWNLLFHSHSRPFPKSQLKSLICLRKNIHRQAGWIACAKLPGCERADSFLHFTFYKSGQPQIWRQMKFLIKICCCLNSTSNQGSRKRVLKNNFSIEAF